MTTRKHRASLTMIIRDLVDSKLRAADATLHSNGYIRLKFAFRVEEGSPVGRETIQSQESAEVNEEHNCREEEVVWASYESCSVRAIVKFTQVTVCEIWQCNRKRLSTKDREQRVSDVQDQSKPQVECEDR
ncbi:hypothetical protein RRF57_011204 [Xylaria bambusicola]|uniref:Uncharacterized protein n=1 Tax=Xylaria bambusicola TaxID=326684 RepID=A0AAN7Z9K1_9PEZI